MASLRHDMNMRGPCLPCSQKILLMSHDVVSAIEEFAANPRPGEVYNLGGGRANSIQ